MKTMILLLATLLSFAGCREDGSEIKQETGQETTIYGTWQLTALHVSPGYGGYGDWWSSVNDGYMYNIRTNGTFSTTEGTWNPAQCSEGVFSIDESIDGDMIISFDYNCEDTNSLCSSESSKPTCDYYFTMEQGYLDLDPIYRNCYEGCTRRFTKIEKRGM